MTYILDIAKIEPGDILLTAQSAATSKIIRKATASEFSHAMLYVSRGSYIHSDGDGVHSGNIQRLIFKHADQVKVFRIEDSSSETIEKACEFARSKVGTQYSVPQAVKSTLYRKSGVIGTANRQFCSRLVAQSYAYAGVILTENPDYCYPEDLAKSTRILEVQDCLRLATIEEEDFANSENPLQKQADITNFLLSEARKLFGKDIQTLEQISAELLQRPEHDQSVCQIYRSSGYLKIWEYDVTKNFWRYNGPIFCKVSIPNDELKQLAANELESAIEQDKLFTRMLHTYKTLLVAHDLEYLRLNIDLYTTLTTLTKSRVLASLFVLKNA